tara:strand:+ start:788 stop:1279 length:492 start_codon:yes stop_codon:yes gene_type:complete
MTIILKNKDTLVFDDFYFKCSIGKKGLSKGKREGDLKTPKGNFDIDCLYYRSDRIKKPKTKLKTKVIKKNMGWCNDINNKKYNRIIKVSKKIKHEKMYRIDHKYDLVIPIKYNFKKPIPGRGSAIFLHLTKNYNFTAGCVALSLNDFLILLKLVNKKTKIRII